MPLFWVCKNANHFGFLKKKKKLIIYQNKFKNISQISIKEYSIVYIYSLEKPNDRWKPNSIIWFCGHNSEHKNILLKNNESKEKWIILYFDNNDLKFIIGLKCCTLLVDDDNWRNCGEDSLWLCNFFVCKSKAVSKFFNCLHF